MRALSPMPPRNLPPLVQPITPPGIAPPMDDISAFQVTVPGNAVLFAFFIAMAVAITFAHERHTGVWKRVLAAPVPRWQTLLGKVVPYFLISLVQLAFLFGARRAVRDEGRGEHARPRAALDGAVVVRRLVRPARVVVRRHRASDRQHGAGAHPRDGPARRLHVPALVHAGVHEVDRQRGVPQSWALDGFYTVLVRQGSTVADVAPQLGALLAFALGFTLLGIWRFEFER